MYANELYEPESYKYCYDYYLIEVYLIQCNIRGGAGHLSDGQWRAIKKA